MPCVACAWISLTHVWCWLSACACNITLNSLKGGKTQVSMLTIHRTTGPVSLVLQTEV